MAKTLVLLDGNSLLFRGFFAVRSLTNSKGLPTNALFGFTQMLLGVTEKHSPDLMFCAWDTHEPTFRHELFTEYKGTRQDTPDDLIQQGPYARRLADVFRAISLEAPGYEADDIIGTLATQGKAAGYDVLIVSGDSDMLQLVQPGIQVLTTIKGITDTVLYDEAAVEARYGLKPIQLTDYRALKGDSSDNIPGVPGIGEKTATTLLQAFPTVEEIEARLGEVTPARIQEKIRENLDKMRLSKELAVIKKDIPLPEAAVLPAPDDCPEYSPDYAAIKVFFDELEFRTLARRVEAKATGSPLSPGPSLPITGEGGEEQVSATPAVLTVTEVQTEADVMELLSVAKAAGKVGIRLHTDEASALDAVLYGVAIATGGERVFYCAIAPPAPASGGTELGGLFDTNPPLSPVIGREGPGEGGETEGAKACHALLADPAIGKMTYDGRTDLTILQRHGFAVSSLAFDTELAAYLLFAGQRATYPLRDIAQNHAGRELPPALEKKERATLDTMTVFERDKQLAIASAEAIFALQEVLEPRLEKDKLSELLQTLELPLVPVLAEMERTGLLLDTALLGKIAGEMGGQVATLEKAIHAEAGVVFAVNSPKQLAEVLFETLKLPSGKKTKTGYSTDADVLEPLALEHKIVAEVLQYRELAKLKSTYADALPALVRSDGRVHTSLNQTVAATGRLSSSNPNLQNIPIRTAIGREIRKAFVAPPGRILLSADYSQIELRIFAHVANDADMRAAFTSGEDIHKYTASKVYGVAPGDVTSDMRRAAKTVNFAVLYGISDFALARQLKIPQSEAKALKESYFARFPGVKVYLDATIEFAQKNGYVQTLFGRRRWIPDINNRVFNFRQAAERAAANMPIQGLSADIMKKAMLSVAAMLKTTQLPALLLLQVHDELLFEVDQDATGELGTKVKACMENAYELSVSLDVEVKTGPSWGDTTVVE
ncbi:DNA polymerase I [Armatimonas sp.]|uniref:DNA polymerase I n=1 Tax=Armatimonas sp. TaxID=1872638 RepID=UPI00286C1228|nr:DNA polymerase I [Armatimonas sp.]